MGLECEEVGLVVVVVGGGGGKKAKSWQVRVEEKKKCKDNSG